MPVTITTNSLTKTLRAAAIMAMEQNGWTLDTVPLAGRAAGTLLRGRYTDGPVLSIGLRTSKNREIAYQPSGSGWKALDEVDLVVVAAVDDAAAPKKVDVLLFRTHVVRKAFDAAKEARIKAGIAVNDDVGMWLAIDQKGGDNPRHVGSGFVKDADSRWVMPLPDWPVTAKIAEADVAALEEAEAVEPAAPKPATIAAVLAAARAQIAEIAGVPLEAVTLTLSVTAA